jgi:hypothetical protein
MQIGDLVRYKPKFISELPEENAGNVGIIVDRINLGNFQEIPSYFVRWVGTNEISIWDEEFLEVVCK